MKCPYCGVHYMEDERECPVCGKRSPIFGKKQRGTSHRHRTLDDTPTTTCAHVDDRDRRSRDSGRDTSAYPSIRKPKQQTKSAKKSKTASSRAKPAPSLSGAAERREKEKRGLPVKLIIILIVLLLNFLPFLIELAENLFHRVPDFGSGAQEIIYHVTPEMERAEPAVYIDMDEIAWEVG